MYVSVGKAALTFDVLLPSNAILSQRCEANSKNMILFYAYNVKRIIVMNKNPFKRRNGYE